MLSENQLNAQIKLLEVWKALNINIKDSPLKILKKEINEITAVTRSLTNGKLIETAFSNTLSIKTCINDDIRLWNIAPSD